MNTFFEQIARHYETLSSNEQLVIDFVMRDHNIDRLKIKTITDALFVSSATVMRAARKLGYSNFSQLKYSAAMTQDEQAAPLPSEDFDTMGSQHFFGQFAKRLFVKLGHTRKAMLLVQDSLSVLVPLRGCKRSRCKRRLALSDH